MVSDLPVEQQFYALRAQLLAGCDSHLALLAVTTDCDAFTRAVETLHPARPVGISHYAVLGEHLGVEPEIAHEIAEAIPQYILLHEAGLHLALYRALLAGKSAVFSPTHDLITAAFYAGDHRRGGRLLPQLIIGTLKGLAAADFSALRVAGPENMAARRDIEIRTRRKTVPPQDLARMIEEEKKYVAGILNLATQPAAPAGESLVLRAAVASPQPVAPLPGLYL